MIMENFEEPLGDERRRLLEQELRKDLHQFLLSMNKLDQRSSGWTNVSRSALMWRRNGVARHSPSHSNSYESARNFRRRGVMCCFG